MSNKLDFYHSLIQYQSNKKVPYERLLKEFQATHPGVQWRKVGKDEYQVKFRQSEQWLNVSSWLSNYLSVERKRLIDQIRHSSQIFSTEEILEQFDCSNVSTDFLLKYFEPLQEQFLPMDLGIKMAKERDSYRKESEDLKKQLVEKSKELAEVRTRSQQEILDYERGLRASLREKTIQLFNTFWDERSGVTKRLSSEDVGELLKRVVVNLE